MRSSKVVKPNNKNTWEVEQEKQGKQGGLRVYGGTSDSAEMFWDINNKTIRDNIFEFRVGKECILLDAEEMMRYLRWV